MAKQCYFNHESPLNQSVVHGFTLIEFVITTIIVGILSAAIMPRFLGTNTFNAVLVRDQLIASIRNAQQSALGRSGVALTISPNASGRALSITHNDGGGVVDSSTVDLSGVSISSDTNITASCGVTNGQNVVSNVTPLSINFGELGSLSSSGVVGNTGVVSSALRICLNNDPVFSVCVSPSGFAYAGDCDG